MSTPWEVFPSAFIVRLSTFLGKSQAESVLAALCQKRATTFRANRLKTTNDALQRKLKLQGYASEQIPWYPDAFILKNKSLMDLTESPEYKNGELYVQSLSSMIPPLILDPKPEEKVLDITAAPGSKTTQIAALMENRGEIVANDTSPTRLFRLAANIKTQGATIVQTTKTPAQILWKTYPEYFDRVLVDVPCSMEGRFFCQDPKTYKDWTLRKVKELAVKQSWMLRSAISCAKPGGVIVYSTCTLSPEENEGVIDWILKKEKSAIELVSVKLKNIVFQPALTSWGEKMVNSQISRCARIYPATEMEGFFIAKIRKLKSTVPQDVATTLS